VEHIELCSTDSRPDQEETRPGEDRNITTSITARAGGRAALKLAIASQLSAGITHDIRNILTAISGGLELAQMAKNAERMRYYIATALDGVKHGIDLTNQLSSFSNDNTFEARPSNANELLTAIEPFLNYSAGINLSLDLDATIPRCLMESAQFTAAILNLVINARDAMPHGGEIRISTRRWAEVGVNPRALAPLGYVRVRIEDNGHGMSSETARHIFEPFFTTKGAKGTGLGLPQVYAFMQMSGGHIDISSKPGFGTTCDLFFPAVP